MLTCQSKRACLCREVPTDHEAHGQRGGGRSTEEQECRALLEKLQWESTQEAEAEDTRSTLVSTLSDVHKDCQSMRVSRKA